MSSRSIRGIIMKKVSAAVAFALLATILPWRHPALSKELPLLTEKKGTFEFMSRADYTDPRCGFTGAEIQENLRELGAVVNTMRTNPVLSGLMGFDGRARIYNIGCGDAGAYGIQSRISFEFASWFMGKDGRPARILMEPPCWDLIINKQTHGDSPIVGEPNYFIVPAAKETVRPGIDLYDGELYIIYNPDRPAYWLPVTVRDCYDKIIAHWKREPDKVAADYMLKFIEKQYADFPKSDLDKPARYGSRSGNPPNIMSVTADPTGSPVVRVNPEYWNRNLPRSAIQFMYCRIINNKKYIRQLKEEYLKKNSTSYSLYRFLETLDTGTAESLGRHLRR
jgi:hypothetical protein